MKDTGALLIWSCTAFVVFSDLGSNASKRLFPLRLKCVLVQLVQLGEMLPLVNWLELFFVNDAEGHSSRETGLARVGILPFQENSGRIFDAHGGYFGNTGIDYDSVSIGTRRTIGKIAGQHG